MDQNRYNYNLNHSKQIRNERMAPFLGSVLAIAVIGGLGVVGYEKVKGEFEHSKQHEIVETHLPQPDN